MRINNISITLKNMELLKKEGHLQVADRSPINGEFPFMKRFGALCGTEQCMDWFKNNLDNFPGDYLEIGSFDGIMICELANHYPDKVFNAVDCFRTGAHTKSGCLYYFVTNNLKLPNVNLFWDMSIDVIPKWRREGRTFGSIFIDGSHDYDTVAFELEQCWSLLSSPGIIMVHDYGSPLMGVAKALDDFLENNHVEHTELDQGWARLFK